MTGTTKWVVGVDLRPSSQGAIRFARWLAGRSPTDRFVGVHVLEEAHLQPALRYHHLDELVQTAQESGHKVIAQVGAAKMMAVVEIVQGVHAERSLEAAREYHYADAIIVGRQAPREGHRILRLGRVARRLLRSLDSPVVVVPPDHDPEAHADGPVVVTTNLRTDATEATRFAAELAARIGSKLLVVYVVPYADDYGAYYVPEASRKKIAEENQRDGQEALRVWIDAHGLEGAEAMVLQGGVVERLLDVVVERKPSMIVCGSRLLSVLERLLLASIGSELAATAPCPVAVVPPVIGPAS